MTPLVKGLTAVELSELDKNEAVIKRGLKTFADVGNALLAIRDARLYREQHETFEAYCRERWGFSKTHANRLVESALVMENLTPIGVKPATESQARPLAKLPPAEQPGAWEAATNKAKEENRTVTAKDVEAEVARRVADPMDGEKKQEQADSYTSETMAGLKRYWKMATKKEKREFLTWIEN